MKAHLIRCNGSEEDREVASMRELGELIGAQCLDTVDLRDGRVMMIDDAGYEFAVDRKKMTAREAAQRGHVAASMLPPDAPVVIETHVPGEPRKPANEKATALYWALCRPGTTHRIVGDVAILIDADCDDGR